MAGLEDIIAVVMFFGIPLSAIIGGFWIKHKRLMLQAGQSGEATQRMAALEEQNAELRRRIEVL